MEYDQYDNPATKYIIYRDEQLIARGVSRLYPTTLPYMLEQVFPHLVTRCTIPKDAHVWEGSRFCIDHTLSLEQRKRIAQELVIGYLEVALYYQIKAIVGMMYPAYLRTLFSNNGWDVQYLGEVTELDDGNRARAALLPVSTTMLDKVRNTTGIHQSLTEFGEQNHELVA